MDVAASSKQVPRVSIAVHIYGIGKEVKRKQAVYLLTIVSFDEIVT